MIRCIFLSIFSSRTLISFLFSFLMFDSVFVFTKKVYNRVKNPSQKYFLLTVASKLENTKYRQRKDLNVFNRYFFVSVICCEACSNLNSVLDRYDPTDIEQEAVFSFIRMGKVLSVPRKIFSESINIDIRKQVFDNSKYLDPHRSIRFYFVRIYMETVRVFF